MDVPGVVDAANAFNPPSPVELKPDLALMANQQQQQRPNSPSGVNYPPLSGSKHFCTICGDRASGKHYGVYSCEGCKGFFKRTVRKELTYACRENRECTIDKRQRNRCQYCRYKKCLMTGMRREAVQEERHRTGNGRDSRDGSKDANNVNEDSLGAASANNKNTPAGSGFNATSIVDRILEAENMADSNNFGGLLSSEEVACFKARPHLVSKNKLLCQLIRWAKHIPHFSELNIDDQVTLIRSGWNELLIAGLAFRSMNLAGPSLNEEAILNGNGAAAIINNAGGLYWNDNEVITRENAHLMGVGDIFDRVIVELVGKMREMKMDKAELGCLRAIVLFNPDAKGLEANPGGAMVETFREKFYATLEEYCRNNHENEPSRFAKLLLRLPALRSIGLKCVEHLFFYKLVNDDDLPRGPPEPKPEPQQQAAASAASASEGNNDAVGDASSNGAESGSEKKEMSALDRFIKQLLIAEDELQHQKNTC